MKGIKKALIGLVAGIVAIFGVAALAACSDNSNNNNNNNGSEPQTVTGEYSYEAWGHTYGVKVNVTVKNGKITKVETVVPEGWTQATETDQWDRTIYLNGEANLLKTYEGLDVDDVVDMEIGVLDSKAPETSLNEDYTPNTNFDPTTYEVDGKDLLIDGATQSCGRLLLAVQNALEKLDK